MSKLNEEEVRSLRAEVVVISQQILHQKINIVDGAARLSSLRHEVCDDSSDEEFLLFVGIASESDHLPLSSTRKNYSEAALERADAETEEIENHYREQIQKACNKLIERFSDAT